MYFTWDYVIRGFVFQGLNIDTSARAALVVFIVFLMSFTSESLKTFQKVLNARLKDEISKNNVSQSLKEDLSGTCPLTKDLHIPINNNNNIKKRRLQLHSIQTIIYTFNLTIGFFLMNIAMCYYSGHLLAIIIGCGVSYFFFHDMGQSSAKQSDYKINFSKTIDCNETTKSSVDLIENIQ